MTFQPFKFHDDLLSRLKRRAVESGHRSIGEYIVALVKADLELDERESDGKDYDGPEHLKVKDEADFEAKLLEALQSPAHEMTDARWEEIERGFIERYNKTGL